MQSSTTPKNACRSRRQTVPRFTLKALPLAAALCCGVLVQAQGINPGVAGLPQGGTVAAGAVAGDVSGNRLTLTQSSARAVLDWRTFNIDAGKEVRFVQPDANSAVLNRVSASAGMSEIYGSLNANGAVLLMNPNGVLFGRGASINVGSLIATTGTVNDARFMQEGVVAITGAGAGSVRNQGNITAAHAGLVALVAPSVSNEGTVVANGGTIMLAGAATATISFNGGLYEFATGGSGASVGNSGMLQADGGSVLFTAASASNVVDSVINMDGVIQARSAEQRGGVIVLDGGDAGRVQVSGRLDASGMATQAGGRITVTGRAVELTPTARLDASGEGGGTILVGGDWQGKGTERNAITTTVAQGATLAADGGERGNGGAVVVWADGETRFQGAISARGGAQAGDGGRVEVSGKQSLGYYGTVDAGATAGQAGSLLLDPLYAVISSNAAGTAGDTQTINAAALAYSLSGTNVTVQADNRITVNAAVDASANPNKHDLALNAPAIDLNAKIKLKDDAALSGTASIVNVNGPDASIQNGVDVAAGGGMINVASGTYAENVSISKALTLNGAGAGQTVIEPTSGTAVTVSGNIGASASVTLDGIMFRKAPDYGVRVNGGTVLGQLTISNSTFTGMGRNGFLIDGSPTAGAPGLASVTFANDTFTANGLRYDDPAISSLGYGDLSFNYYNGNVRLDNVHITGNGEFMGIQMRGASPTANVPLNAGTVVFNNVTIDGSFRRPANARGTWNPSGPGDAIHILEYASVAGMSFNNVVITPTVGHGMFLEGLGSTINIGNTRFGTPDTTITGSGPSPTISRNIFIGTNNNNARTNVDASQATFTGAADGFAIEDRVLHALDLSALGLVTWSPGNVYVTPASGSIQRGIDAASAGNTVNVAVGTYAEQLTLNKANLTLNGVGVADAKPQLLVPDRADVDGITITSNNVTVQGLEIAGPLNGTPYYNYYNVAYSSGNPPVVTPGNVSRGIRVGSGITGFTIQNNNIHDVRTGILIYGTNNTGTIRNNTIENTKSGISVQYTDGAGVAITGNSEGPVGNEWGVNLHLNIASSAKLAAPTLAWQQSLLDLSAANGGWAVQDQGYLAANRTQVNVVASSTSPTNQGSRLSPIDTIQGGINAAVTGGSVNVAVGSYAENVEINNRYNLRFNDVTLQGLTLNAGAAGSGIGGKVTATTAAGIALNAPIRLLADTTLVTQGADIVLGGDVQNAGAVPYALALTAGAGGARGNVHMTTGGTSGNPLGLLDVDANNFSLADTLWVTAYQIDARGNVALSNHTLNATAPGVTNTLAATGNVTGSTTSQGNIEVVSSAQSEVNIAAQGRASVAAETVRGTLSGSEVVATAQESMQVTVTASNTATLVADTMTATVVAPTVAVDAGANAQLNLQSTTATVHADGPVTVQGSANTVNIDAPSGSVQGSFGDVNNAGTGLFSVNGRPELNQTLSVNAENNRVIPGSSALAGSLGNEPVAGPRVLQVVALAGRGAGVPVVRSSPQAAGTAILEQGQAVELDLAPGRERE